MGTDVELQIRRHVEALTAAGPRFGDAPGVAAALRYISDQLREFGLAVELQRYGSELSEVNLLAEVAGTDPDAPVLDVGAHWDTVEESPGADDNASGVAGLLVLAAELAGRDAPRQGVRLCFFGGEEASPEPFLGSTAHVDAIGDRPVDGAIILEMIGYRSTRPGSQAVPERLRGLVELPEAGDFIALIGDEASAEYVVALAEGARSVPGLSVFPLLLPAAALGLVSRSDHVPYWRTGRRGVMVSDTADYRNPNYHTAGDVPSTLDYEFAAGVTTMVANAVEYLTAK
jgi:Zn-dependent M28 family amino/carboxypeptidase